MANSQKHIETETARMVYRSINKEAQGSLRALFDKLSDFCAGKLRNARNAKTDLKLPRLKTSSGQRCFAYRGGQFMEQP